MSAGDDTPAGVVRAFPTVPNREGITLRQCIDVYMAAYSGRDHSRAHYLVVWVEAMGDRRVADIDADAIADVLDRMAATPVQRFIGRDRETGEAGTGETWNRSRPIRHAPDGLRANYAQGRIDGSQNQIEGDINNWTAADLSSSKQQLTIGPPVFSVVSLPAVAIPAGYKISISRQNDSSNNVTRVTWVVIDNLGNTTNNKNNTQSLLSIPGVTAMLLAPIVACQLGGGESAVLSSGAGTFTYTASEALTVLSAVPSCSATGEGTAETVNTVYGLLPAGPSKKITQTFSVKA